MSFGSKTLFIERVIFSSFLSLVLKMLVRDSDKLNIEWKSQFQFKILMGPVSKIAKGLYYSRRTNTVPLRHRKPLRSKIIQTTLSKKKKKNLSIDHKRGDQVLQQIIGADLV